MPLSCKPGMRPPGVLSSLDFPLRSVPVFFEICDEGRAEMAIGLLTAIDCHVAPECIEWFFAHAKCPSVTRRANHAGAGEIVDHARNRCVQLIGRHNEIANHASFRAVALEATAHHDGLPRRARTNETRQTQIGSARYDAFLARR